MTARVFCNQHYRKRNLVKSRNMGQQQYRKRNKISHHLSPQPRGSLPFTGTKAKKEF
jgi:hypothetical protein